MLDPLETVGLSIVAALAAIKAATFSELSEADLILTLDLESRLLAEPNSTSADAVGSRRGESLPVGEVHISERDRGLSTTSGPSSPSTLSSLGLLVSTGLKFNGVAATGVTTAAVAAVSVAADTQPTDASLSSSPAGDL